MNDYINKFDENKNKNKSKNENTITMYLKVKYKKLLKITIKYGKILRV